MLFFEDDDLDTGKGFPINASQLTNEIPLGNACIKTPNQLTDWVPGNPPVTHLHASISYLSFLIFRNVLPGCYLCMLGIYYSFSVPQWTNPNNPTDVKTGMGLCTVMGWEVHAWKQTGRSAWKWQRWQTVRNGMGSTT